MTTAGDFDFHCQSFETNAVLVKNGATVLNTSSVLIGDKLFQVLWKSEDLDLFTPKSAPVLFPTSPTPWNSNILASITSMSTPGPTTGPTKTSSHPTPTSSSHNILSVGAKAGIGVGIGLGCIAIFGILFLFLRWQRQRPNSGLRPELEATSRPGELPGTKPAEADGTPRAELDTGWRGHEMRQDAVQ